MFGNFLSPLKNGVGRQHRRRARCAAQRQHAGAKPAATSSDKDKEGKTPAAKAPRKRPKVDERSLAKPGRGCNSSWPTWRAVLSSWLAARWPGAAVLCGEAASSSLSSFHSSPTAASRSGGRARPLPCPWCNVVSRVQQKAGYTAAASCYCRATLCPCVAAAKLLARGYWSMVNRRVHTITKDYW